MTEASATDSHGYLCEDGSLVWVSHINDFSGQAGARVMVRGRQYELRRQVSASGEQYAGEGLVWWNKGKAGILQSNSRAALQCRLIESR